MSLLLEYMMMTLTLKSQIPFDGSSINIRKIITETSWNMEKLQSKGRTIDFGEIVFFSKSWLTVNMLFKTGVTRPS